MGTTAADREPAAALDREGARYPRRPSPSKLRRPPAAHPAARQLRIPPLGRCSVALTWVVADRRRRDADNLVPTLKALCDGLVDAGVVADDTPDLMHKHMPRIEYRPGATPHLILTIAPHAEGSASDESASS